MVKLSLYKVVEAFEVISGSSVIHLQARGRGVTPSFVFEPDREVFMISSAAGKTADMTISVWLTDLRKQCK